MTLEIGPLTTRAPSDVRNLRGFLISFRECVIQIYSYKNLVYLIEKLRTTPYDSENSEHENKLMQLWSLLMPDEPLENRITKQWGSIGFQGDDPKTDFRGMGILGLDNLLYFSSNYSGAARHVLCHSHHPQYGHEEFHPNCLSVTVKQSMEVMVWECMSVAGVRCLQIVQGMMNAAKYIKTLQTRMFPSAKEMFPGEDFAFQDDNAPCHRAKVVKDWLAAHNLKRLDWLAQSPDCAPQAVNTDTKKQKTITLETKYEILNEPKPLVTGSNLRFADDVVLFSESPQELQLMVEELKTANNKVDLEINETYLYSEFDKFWLSQKPRDIMEFSKIRDLFETEITKKLSDPNTVFKIKLAVETL
ncbi:ELMO domain-containing protein 2 [Nymphon striatum]|nr:ELMO domain-containing protein 2 [Nymphon striatum]